MEVDIVFFSVFFSKMFHTTGWDVFFFLNQVVFSILLCMYSVSSLTFFFVSLCFMIINLIIKQQKVSKTKARINFGRIILPLYSDLQGIINLLHTPLVDSTEELQIACTAVYSNTSHLRKLFSCYNHTSPYEHEDEDLNWSRSQTADTT